MQTAARDFLAELHQPRVSCQPRWLSFCGESWLGKTFLMELIREAAPTDCFAHPSFQRAGRKLKWGDCIWRLRNEETRAEACADIDEALEHRLLLIDDIGGSKDSEFSASALFRIMEKRINRWTLITSNRSLKQIEDTIDARISSRMVRDRNVCLEIKTVSFAQRGSQ